MSGSGDDLPSRLRENVSELRSAPDEWVLLGASRLVIAAIVTALFGIVLVVPMATGLVTVENTGQMIYLAQGILTATVTLVTIVVAINQLVLSRELRTPGQLQDQIRDVTAYRRRVEEKTNRAVMPATPGNFLPVLLDGTRNDAQRLGGLVEGHENDELVEEVTSFVSTVTTDVDSITDRLSDSGGGIFETLEASLETNFSRSVVEARRLQSVYDDELSTAAHDELDELIASLQQVDIARQYFKSIYLQSELADLSRLLLYVGLPAAVGAVLLYLIYVGGPSPAVEREYLTEFVWAVLVLSFGPLAVLFSFVVRIATVAKRTVAITPFTTPTQEPELSEAADTEE